jgi:predicted DNA binding CopG/RHH family protein
MEILDRRRWCRLSLPEMAPFHTAADRKKGIPYQTYIKTLLHEALEREIGAAEHR